MATNNKSSSTVTDLDSQNPTTTQEASKAVEAVEDVKGSNFDDELQGAKVNLMIMAGQEDGGNDAVSIGLNGYMYQIPRGVQCLVPVEVAEIVKNAVVMQYIPGPKGTPVERAQPRFAYTITPVA